jgi:hypothetical protein
VCVEEVAKVRVPLVQIFLQKITHFRESICNNNNIARTTNEQKMMAESPHSQSQVLLTNEEEAEWAKEFQHPRMTSPLRASKNIKRKVFGSSSSTVLVSCGKKSGIEYVTGAEQDDPFATENDEMLAPTPMSVSLAAETRQEPASTAVSSSNDMETRLSLLALNDEVRDGDVTTPSGTPTTTTTTTTTKTKTAALAAEDKPKKHKKSKSLSNAFTISMNPPAKIKERTTTTLGTIMQEEQQPTNVFDFKLALPEALAMMTGKASVPAPGLMPSQRPMTTMGPAANNSLGSGEASDAFFGLVSATTTGAGPAQSAQPLSANDFVLRSSELEPYQHQVTVPPAQQLSFHAKLCQLMQDYCLMIQNHSSSFQMFDFNVLAGKSHNELLNWHCEMVSKEEREQDDSDAANNKKLKPEHKTKKGGGGVFAMGMGSSSSSTKKKNKHKSKYVAHCSASTQNDPDPAFLKSLLDSCEDILVEGRLHVGATLATRRDDVFSMTGTEVTVFSSHRHRQFVVCFRGTPEQQEKPISLSYDKKHGKSCHAMIICI